MVQFVKNIFICWFQGRDHLDKLNTNKSLLFKENVKNWQLLNPTWNCNLVDDNDLRKACSLFSKECLDTYDSFDEMHLKIDLGRYVLIYLYGGIYVDMDMYILRGLETLPKIREVINKNKHVLGVSSLNLNKYESLVFVQNTKMLNNATMLSSPKNPILFNMIVDIIKNAQIYKDQIGFLKIQYITGPMFFNKFLYKYLNGNNTNEYDTNENITVFPHYIFEPSPAYGDSDIRGDTIAIHKMEQTWVSDELKLLSNVYYKIKPYFLLIILLIVIFIYRKEIKNIL